MDEEMSRRICRRAVALRAARDGGKPISEPPADLTTLERINWRNGYDANRNYAPASDNPSADPDHRQVWQAGWDQAQTDYPEDSSATTTRDDDE